MPSFTDMKIMAMDSSTLYKLIIMYMLNKVNFPLTNTQITDFFLEKEYTNYFNVQQVISELIDSHLISVETVRNTSYYHITSEGGETLGFFVNKIPSGIIDDMDLFLIKNLDMNMIMILGTYIYMAVILHFKYQFFHIHLILCLLNQLKLKISHLSM